MVSYFLGANAPSGFFSLYDDLLPEAQAQTLYILKGGPGCGKSTCMRQVARAAQAAGEPVEVILCSGDPDSLDAVLLPERGVALVDGTAPHVVEPTCPGAVERYVNLGEAYDYVALSERKNEIQAAMHGYKECYEQAYRALRGSCALEETLHSELCTDTALARLSRRAEQILSREALPTAPGGRVTRRFLSAVTCQGRVCRWESVEEQCPRVYELIDPYGLAPLLLTALLPAAVGTGTTVVACPSPLHPERLEHLLLPEQGLAFVTSTPELPYPGHAKRRVRLAHCVERDRLRTVRARMRFTQRLADSLKEDAVAALAQAKAKHDALEAIYNPHVDFSFVHETAHRICSELKLT